VMDATQANELIEWVKTVVVVQLAFGTVLTTIAAAAFVVFAWRRR